LISPDIEKRSASIKASKDQVFYTWTNVNFSVPLKNEDRAAIELGKVVRGDD